MVAKKTFSELAETITANSIEEKDPKQEAIARLKSVAEMQFKPGGPLEMEASCCNLNQLMADLESFASLLTEEEIVKTRLYVTVAERCDYHINLVRKDMVRVTNNYTLLFETERKGGKVGYVIRIILNHIQPAERISSILNELGFTSLNSKVISTIALKKLDDKLGINIKQLRFEDFTAKYGKRKDYFELGQLSTEYFQILDEDRKVFGVYDDGRLILTSPAWRRNVFIKMPSKGRPWYYGYVKEGAFRKEAFFRITLYGKKFYEEETIKL